MVVSVVTQYRILKFVAVNVHETQLLRKPLRHLKLGTYKDLVTASMETSVFELIHKLVHHNISSIPILNSDGTSPSGSEGLQLTMQVLSQTSSRPWMSSPLLKGLTTTN